MTSHRYAYALHGRTLALFRLGVLLFVLNIGLVLPAALVSGVSAIGPADVVSFDLVVMLAIVILANGTRVQRSARRIVSGLYVVFLLYELYDAAMKVALKRPGLFYDDIQHIAGTVHLIGNAATPLHLAIGAISSLGIGGFCWFAVRAFRTIGRVLQVDWARRAVIVGVCVTLPVMLYGLAFDRGNGTPLYEQSVLMTGEKIALNLVASAELRQRVQEFQRLPADSTYARYETASLARRPNVFILFVESYGDVLRRNEETAATYQAMMKELDHRLSRTGWQSASTMSLAPVNGGTSWLSVGSVLMGMPIKHQSMFNAIEPDLDQYPHFIHTLQASGYRTAVLQPPTRPRLGIGVSNPYGFDDTFFFADMKYTGPRYGWGIVPDQYSLQFVHEQIIARSQQPVALLFEMVASHSPWDSPPPFVDDWRALNEPDPGRSAPRSSEAAREVQPPVVTTGNAPEPPLPRISADKDAPIHRLFRTIRYDWQVISEYMMNEMPDSSLVLVLGDHQPPVLSTDSDAVPVHVFSRDSAHIDAAVSHGFQRGLFVQPPSESATAPAFRHAGLYSLMMNLIAQPLNGESASRSFPVLPGGVERPDRRRSAPR